MFREGMVVAEKAWLQMRKRPCKLKLISTLFCSRDGHRQYSLPCLASLINLDCQAMLLSTSVVSQ